MKTSLTKYLIYALVLLIPLTHKEMFSVYDPDLVWSKFVLSVIAVFGLYSFLKNVKRYIKDPFFVLLVLTLFFQVLSMFQSKDILNSLRYISFFSAIVLSYPVILDFITNDVLAITKIIKLYLFAFFVVLFFLSYQYYLQTNFGVAIGGVWPVPGFSARYASTFWDVNHFGIYLASTFFLFIPRIVGQRSGNLIEKALYIVGVFGILISFYLTKSRSSMIGFASGLSLFFYVAISLKGYKRRFLSKSKLFVLTGILIPTIPLAFMWVFAERIRDFFLYRSVSFFSHLFLLKVGVLVGLHKFFTGIGVNSFYAYFKQSTWASAYYYIDSAALNVKLPLHSLWLESLAETGILGFVVYVSLWVLLLGGLIKLAYLKHDFVALGLASGVLSFLVGGFFYSYKSEFFWFYVLVSLAYVSVNYKGKYVDLEKGSWNIKSINFYGTCVKIRSLSLSLVTAISLLLPFIFIFKPLTHIEIAGMLKYWNVPHRQNFLLEFYQKMIFNFRYILGSYSYVGRLLNSLLYVGGIVVGYGILSKYMSRKKMAFLGIIVGLSSFLFVFNLQRSSYDGDLTFMLELGQNRGLFDRSEVYVDENVDYYLLQFYCEKVERPMSTVRGAFLITPCTVRDDGKFLSSKGIKITTKSVFIGSTDFVDKWNESILGYAPGLKLARIDRGRFSMLIFEPKAKTSI